MKTITITAALLASAVALGCSSNTTKDPDPGPGTPAPTGTVDPTPSDGTTSGAPAAVTVKAPTINSVEKMAGAFHVMWTNAEPSCDAIEGERQAQMSDGSIAEKYKVVFSVPGEADNKHDASASGAMKYTYRLRCKMGTKYSVYSNEMSGSPK